MSVRVMSQIWDDNKIKDQGQLLVLLALADFANDSGENCFPTIPTIAAKTRHGRRAIFYILKKLVEQGYLFIESGGGKHKPNKYRILTQRFEETVQPLHGFGSTETVQLTTSNGAIDDIKRCNPRHDTVQSIAPHPSVTTNEPPVQPPSTEFERFWSAYPRKQAKQNALKAFKKGRCYTKLPEILEAISKQKETRQWKKDGGQFIPMPASWLNAGRWEDEVKPEQPKMLF